MDRRELFRIAGTAGIGVMLSEAGHADDHHASGAAKPAMPPLEGVHLHFCGIHVAKRDPKFQIITQHYCAGLTDEMHQCLLYDSDRENARLLGVEYIISDRMYRELSDAEKRYWHPHTYEVLAGGLIGPEMSPDDEMKFMKYILTTWGKTWHTWPDPTTSVPIGEPLLMWSLMADDQVDKQVLAARDRDFNVSASKLRTIRTKEIGHDPPQIPFPKSMDEIGRQWTLQGEDKPPKPK
jgi:Protein of unknown function (DUF1264)